MSQPTYANCVGRWFDSRRQLYYTYDYRADQLVHQDGLRLPRPAQTSRTALLSAATAQTSSAGTQSAPSPSQQPLDPRHVSQVYSIRPTAPAPNPQTPPFRAAMSPPTSAGIDQIVTGVDQLAVHDAHSPPEHVRTQTVRTQDGITLKATMNSRTHVQTRFATEPSERITDPVLLRRGVRAHMAMFGTEGSEERLYSTFKVRDKPKRFFSIGRVFLVLWTEPAGGTAVTSYAANDRTMTDRGLTIGRYGEGVHSKVRRFVVIREGLLYCSALPITTYGGQGVGKVGVAKSEHVIIYTGTQAPHAMQAELPRRDEQGMCPIPIRVVPDDPTDRLDNASRLDFGKVHTIHHNIKVRPLGMVHSGSMHALISQFHDVWGLPTQPVAGPSATQHGVTGGGGKDDDEEDDDDEDDGDNDSDASDEVVGAAQASSPQSSARSAPRSSPPSSPISQPSPQAQALRAYAQEAQNLRSTIAAHMRQGRSQDQAFELVVRQLLVSRPTLSRSAAVALLNSRLSLGQRAPPTRGTGNVRTMAGAEDEDEQEDEDESGGDDDDDNDDDEDEEGDEENDDEGDGDDGEG